MLSGTLVIVEHDLVTRSHTITFQKLKEQVLEKPDGITGDGSSQKDRDGDDLLYIDWEQLEGLPVVAWLYVDDQISYPVMQASDNTYYLKHNYLGQQDPAGSIFLNSGNQKDFTDWNTILYGHCWGGGKMFGTLERYKNPAYQDSCFDLYLPDGTRHRYQIFAVAEVKEGSIAYLYGSHNENARQEVIRFLQEQSVYQAEDEIPVGNRIVTLSTCSRTGAIWGKRLVVCGMENGCEQIQPPASWYLPSES